MKLLFCTQCEDVFKLPIHVWRSCECGRTRGRYIDYRHAEVNGQGISLAIGNGSLLSAIRRLQASDQTDPLVPRSEVLCWVRPHEGPRNPHTVIVEEEK